MSIQLSNQILSVCVVFLEYSSTHVCVGSKIFSEPESALEEGDLALLSHPEQWKPHC